MQRYSVSGFSPELGYRPFHFAEPIPAVRICAVCGLLPQTTTSLPCRHVLCKTCYPQCLVNGICECPLDGDKFLVKDPEWKVFPMKNLLRRKVKCWNEDNGCDAVMTISDMLKHFDEECVHHTTRCPSCSALLLRTNLCAHRRSNCSTHALPKHAQPLEPWRNSVQEPMITALETTLSECVGELKAGIEQILQEHVTNSERLDEVSDILNALRETVVQISEKQEQEMIVVKNTAFNEVKKDLVAQGEKFDEFSRRLGVLGEDVKSTANATQQSLEKLEQSHAELRRRCTKDDNQLQRVSDIVSLFEGILDEALERATKAIVQKCKTYAEIFAPPKVKEMECGKKALCENETLLLAKNTLSITLHAFCVKEIKALKEKATSTGLARDTCEPIYICGYHITFLLYMKKRENTVSVHAGLQLHKGVVDEFLQWPFLHKVKLTYMHPSSDKHLQVLNVTPFDPEHCGRPTKSRNAEFYWNHFVRLEDLEREGYIEADQLSLKYELLPSSK
uniref:Putative tnf receptor-associated factor 6 midgut overexpressed n=1 Tax=Rhipicephalus microplus TaxID=6941 RepID=A0A6M2CIJ6_RHIMP